MKYRKVMRWIIFSVLLALIPFYVDSINYLISKEPVNLSFSELFGDGELLLISATLLGVALGELFEIITYSVAAPRKSLPLVGISIIFIIVMIIMYAQISVSNESHDSSKIGAISVYMFFISFIISLFCIAISESADKAEIIKLSKEERVSELIEIERILGERKIENIDEIIKVLTQVQISSEDGTEQVINFAKLIENIKEKKK